MSDAAMIEKCQFFVQRKKRHCRMTVKSGNNFCGEHLSTCAKNEDDERTDSKYKRVKCPIDGTHTCYESRLAQHLKVCNAKRLADARPSYIVEGINLGEIDEEQPARVRLADIGQTSVDSVLAKVEAACEKLPEIPKEILCDGILKEEIENESYGHGSRKHLLQNASLLAHLKKASLIRENVCYVEFGAGKGKLTYWLTQTISDSTGSSVLLVDRSSHRHKSDNKLRNEECPIRVSRIRADIGDLRLRDVPDIRSADSVVGIAKHLCGAATDLTIRCLVGLLRDDPESRVSGLIVAFCCHHRCDYSSYVGKRYLRDCGFDRNEFPILCSIASWATCATGNNRNTIVQGDEEKMRIAERESIGRRVKSLLNWGRINYLKSHGFRCRLVRYTSLEVSPENVCMIAVLEKS